MENIKDAIYSDEYGRVVIVLREDFFNVVWNTIADGVKSEDGSMIITKDLIFKKENTNGNGNEMEGRETKGSATKTTTRQC